jgi:hypothetical protein
MLMRTTQPEPTVEAGKPQTHRELKILSAGMCAGMRNYAMALAAQTDGATRRAHIKAARAFHHTYLARLLEASGKSGYYEPKAVA